MKIISLANQKGGVGKTTSTINIGAGLSLLGNRVLIIDIDPQGNVAAGLNIEKQNIKYSTYDILLDPTIINKAIVKTDVENLWVVPSNIHLAGADFELIKIERREYILKQSLELVKDLFDYVLIDCPPSLGNLTINALTASQSVLIPVQCEFFALEGVTQILNTIIQIQRTTNRNLSIEGVLSTMYNTNTLLSKEVHNELKKHFKTKLFSAIIPKTVKLAEAPSFGRTIFQHNKNSIAAESYENVAREIIQRNK